MTKVFDKLPFIARLLILIFVGWIVGGIYRVVKFVEKRNVTTLIVGLLGLFTGIGNIVIEIVDIVTTVLGKGISFCAD